LGGITTYVPDLPTSNFCPLADKRALSTASTMVFSSFFSISQYFSVPLPSGAPVFGYLIKMIFPLAAANQK
jgi:hypothetical protein